MTSIYWEIIRCLASHPLSCAHLSQQEATTRSLHQRTRGHGNGSVSILPTLAAGCRAARFPSTAPVIVTARSRISHIMSEGHTSLNSGEIIVAINEDIQQSIGYIRSNSAEALTIPEESFAAYTSGVSRDGERYTVDWLKSSS